MGGFVENCKNHNAIFSFRFILRNLKELGFGRKSEESVQVLVLHDILNWPLKHLEHLEHFKLVTGGGESSGGSSGEL